MFSTYLRVTRSMKRRRKASFQDAPASRSEKLFSPLCAPPIRRDVPSSHFKLTDLHSEIGILIVDHLDTASQASMALVNKSTASWVSKSLLARVTACQHDEDVEALDKNDTPETVARFISAVTSVCIPEWEKIRFVGGIVQLHCRPDARVPTLGIVEECQVLRSVVGKWDATRQGAVLAQYLATELGTLKPISHFLKRPGDSGSHNQATDERIFRVLNYVMVLNDTRDGSSPEERARARREAPSFEGKELERRENKWRYLARVVRSLTNEIDDPERAATLVHLMLGPNEFYLRVVTGESLEPFNGGIQDVDRAAAENAENAETAQHSASPFFATFDLTDETAGDYAEDCDWKGFQEHWESFDATVHSFAKLFAHMLHARVPETLHLETREDDREKTMRLSELVTTCWSFEFKLALAAFTARNQRELLLADSIGIAPPVASCYVRWVLEHDLEFKKHCAPDVVEENPELSVSLFRALGRDSLAADDFAYFFQALSRDWSAAAKRSVLGNVMRGLVREDLLMPGCECGCEPPKVKEALFEKMASLAAMGVTSARRGGGSEADSKKRKDVECTALDAETATPSRKTRPDDYDFFEALDGLCSPASAPLKKHEEHKGNLAASSAASPTASSAASPGSLRAAHTPQQAAHAPQPASPFLEMEE